jgi:hypothetical protein
MRQDPRRPVRVLSFWPPPCTDARSMFYRMFARIPRNQSFAVSHRDPNHSRSGRNFVPELMAEYRNNLHAPGPLPSQAPRQNRALTRHPAIICSLDAGLARLVLARTSGALIEIDNFAWLVNREVGDGKQSSHFGEPSEFFSPAVSSRPRRDRFSGRGRD